MREVLITGRQAYDWILSMQNKPWRLFTLCSAFLKSNTLEEIFKNLPKKNKVRILVRWQLGDLLTGVSDLDVYKLVLENDWELYIDFAFHGKLYAFEGQGVLVGSANATNAGLGLGVKSNNEVCTILSDPSNHNDFMNQLFENALLVNEGLYNRLKQVVENSENTQFNKVTEWPDDILELCNTSNKPIDKLLVSECLSCHSDFLSTFSKTNKSLLLNDFNLIGYEYIANQEINFDTLGNKFIKSKIFKWLKQELIKNNNQLYFGTVSSLLHSSLINDPRPYRSDVKSLVVNLYSWLKVLGQARTNIIVDRPNYSERLTLL